MFHNDNWCDVAEYLMVDELLSLLLVSKSCYEVADRCLTSFIPGGDTIIHVKNTNVYLLKNSVSLRLLESRGIIGSLNDHGIFVAGDDRYVVKYTEIPIEINESIETRRVYSYAYTNVVCDTLDINYTVTGCEDYINFVLLFTQKINYVYMYKKLEFDGNRVTIDGVIFDDMPYQKSHGFVGHAVYIPGEQRMWRMDPDGKCQELDLKGSINVREFCREAGCYF